jgi:2-C-methyl-D-erythritol 4-phosphate cytidylyltransferase
MKKYAVIVAGGSGSRMGTEIPKQFLLLGNYPILMTTIKRFFSYSSEVGIVVVLPASQMERWKQLCEKFQFNIPHHLVEGGSTRYESVRNGLAVLPVLKEDGVVAIHDGVRPFISRQLIETCYQSALAKGNAVVSVPVKDSIRRIENGKNIAVDRSTLRSIQTPQTFVLSTIVDAYQQQDSPLFTDDASVVEKKGMNIQLIDGSYENIKITTPEDLIVGELILKQFHY